MATVKLTIECDRDIRGQSGIFPTLDEAIVELTRLGWGPFSSLIQAREVTTLIVKREMPLADRDTLASDLLNQRSNPLCPYWVRSIETIY